MSESNKPRWVGFDLGGTKMLSTVFDADFQVLGKKRKRTKSQDGSDLHVDRVIQTIHVALADAGVDKSEVSGIGMGCPGGGGPSRSPNRARRRAILSMYCCVSSSLMARR